MSLRDRIHYALCVSFAACALSPSIRAEDDEKAPALTANLDVLLNFSTLWQCSASEFEQKSAPPKAVPLAPMTKTECLAYVWHLFFLRGGEVRL